MTKSKVADAHRREVLTEIFRQARFSPISTQQFLIRESEIRAALVGLQRDGLVRRHQGQSDELWLMARAIPLLQEPERTEAIGWLDQVSEEILRQVLSNGSLAPVPIDGVRRRAKLKRPALEGCLRLLQEIAVVGSVDSDLVHPQETILDGHSFPEALAHRLKEISGDSGTHTRPRATEHNAQLREEILGSAIVAVGMFADQCRGERDRLSARRITRLLEEKTDLFWPGVGEPPLSTATIEKLLQRILIRFDPERRS